MQVHKALVIKDDPGQLPAGLRELGLVVLTASDRQSAERVIGSERPDLIVVDPFLPHLGGPEFVAALKRQAKAKLIVLTAPRPLAAMQPCWEAGADDCQFEPISLRHLLTRAAVRLWPIVGPLRLGRLILDVVRHRVRVGAVDLELSAREFRLLAELMRIPGLFIPYSELFERVWRRPLASVSDLRALQLEVGRLRRKLQAVLDEPPLSTAVWDEGYQFGKGPRLRPKILVVDADPAARCELEGWLGEQGYDTVGVADGETGWRIAQSEAPDLILVEPVVEKLDGLSLCRMLRRRSDVPILLTSTRPLEIDQLTGLEAGANDYLVKPLQREEVVARVRANLPAAQAGQWGVTHLQAGGFGLNWNARQAWVDQQELHLTRKEFLLLAEFLRHPGVILSRAELVQRSWSSDDPAGAHMVEVHISSLRAKVEQTGLSGRTIKNVPRLGYRLNELSEHSGS